MASSLQCNILEENWVVAFMWKLFWHLTLISPLQCTKQHPLIVTQLLTPSPHYPNNPLPTYLCQVPLDLLKQPGSDRAVWDGKVAVICSQVQLFELLFQCLVLLMFSGYYGQNKPQLPNWPHSLFPCCVPENAISCLETLWFTSAPQSTLKWSETVIELDVAYFSPHTPIFWAALRKFSSKASLPKKSVFGLALSSHSAGWLPALYWHWVFPSWHEFIALWQIHSGRNGALKVSLC